MVSVILELNKIKNMYSIILQNLVTYEKKINKKINDIINYELQNKFEDVLNDLDLVREKGVENRT